MIAEQAAASQQPYSSLNLFGEGAPIELTANATPDETVFIDDSLTGAKAGLAAGVKTFGYVPGGNDGSRAALGIIPVQSMTEIAKHLGV